MSRPILCAPNLVDTTTFTVAFSGGAWSTTYPLTNLAHPKLYKVARSSNALAASTTFDVDLGATRTVRVIAIPKHNLSRAATIRVRAGTDNTFASTNYDSTTVDVWPTLSSPGSGESGDFIDTNNKLSVEVATDYNVGYVACATASYSARYIRIGITDTANSDGYIELHRLFVSSGWELPVYAADVQLQWLDDDTIISRSKGGVDFADVSPKRRRYTLQFRGLTDAQSRTLALSLQRQLGRSEQVYIVYDGDQSGRFYQTSFLATLRDPAPIQWEHTDFGAIPFVLEEVL